jgi:hypothetical protein
VQRKGIISSILKACERGLLSASTISVTLTTVTSTKAKRTTKDTSNIQLHGGAVFWVMELCNVISGYQELEEHIAVIFRTKIKM